VPIILQRNWWPMDERLIVPTEFEMSDYCPETCAEDFDPLVQHHDPACLTNACMASR